MESGDWLEAFAVKGRHPTARNCLLVPSDGRERGDQAGNCIQRDGLPSGLTK